MIYIDINLNNLCGSGDTIGCIYPQVRIGMDCTDNVDVQKLSRFQKNLQHYLEKGLNDCLVSPQDEDGDTSRLAERIEI